MAWAGPAPITTAPTPRNGLKLLEEIIVFQLTKFLVTVGHERNRHFYELINQSQYAGLYQIHILVDDSHSDKRNSIANTLIKAYAINVVRPHKINKYQ